MELRTHNCSQAQQEIIDNEIQKLLKKKIIVKCDHEEGEMISPTFLKEKPHGSLGFILNLKKLNENITKIHFKMETIKLILKRVIPLTLGILSILKTVHSETKSNFTPTQRIEFLGFVIESITMTITLNKNKSQKLKTLCANLLSGVTVIRTISQVFKKLTSSFPASKFGRLHHRNLEVF